MTAFDFDVPTRAARVVVALVAAHGVTDLHSWSCLLVYAVSWLAPLHPKAVTVVFCMLSMTHFSEDVGKHGSLALHLAALAVGARCGSQRAMETMVAYIFAVHLPSHYARCWRRERLHGLALAAVASAATAAAAARTARTRGTLTDGMQRCAIAHMLYEAALASGESRWNGGPSALGNAR